MLITMFESVDFTSLRVKASRNALPWPAGARRRASINSFGYGGSNAHLILEQRSIPGGPRHVSSYISEDDDFSLDDDDDEAGRPYTLVLSANDNASLRANIKALSSHLINPRVKIELPDLAYTLSERRTRLWHRAFLSTRTLTDLDENDFVTGKKSSEIPRIGFIFTGQGAQWPQMGKDVLQYFPWTVDILQELDGVLQSLPDPPKWSLVNELTEQRTPEHLRQPEFSQPLVTALQLCLIAVLESWGIKPQSVVGHSSGEIAAAHAAGFLDRAGAIKASFYRGRAALNRQAEAEKDVGMLAIGVGSEALEPYLAKYAGEAWIACFNSPSSLTVSGKRCPLESLAAELKAAGHFARLLQVDLAYHSPLMDVIGEEYEKLLSTHFASLDGSSEVSMFSSVTGSKKTTSTDCAYWKANMISPVRFNEAVKEMLSGENSPNFLIEIGPSGALGGPISQILKSLANGPEISSFAAWSRGVNAGKTIFDLAGRLFVAGGPVNLAMVNAYSAIDNKTDQLPSTIIDLPNYVWNHSVKYWHENASSKDWRLKQYVNHDLLGSKVLGTTWRSPTWRKLLDIADVPWLKDHKMGDDILLPGSGFITMAVEALYQKTRATGPEDAVITSPNHLSYRFRNIRFNKALVVEEGVQSVITLSLTEKPGSKNWHEFRVSTNTADVFVDHCTGSIRVQDSVEEPLSEADRRPLEFPTSAKIWYKAQTAIGYGFGPDFQKVKKVESISGQRRGRSLVALNEPKSKWSPQSYYPIHPASLDGCFQTVTPALWAGEHSSLNAVLVPSIIDDLVINTVNKGLKEGLSLASSEYSGRGRLEEAKSYFANCSVYDSETGALLMQMQGLRFAKLDVIPKPDLHVFDRISWKPDVTFLSQERKGNLGSEMDANSIIDLIAHKKPTLRVIEANLDGNDTSSTWFEVDDLHSRAAYLQYDFASSDAKLLVGAQTKHEERRNSSFILLNQASEDLGIPRDAVYDLAIVKVSQVSPQDLDRFINNLKSHIAVSGYTLVIEGENAQHNGLGTSSLPNFKAPGFTETPATPRTSSGSVGSNCQTTTPFTDVSTPNEEHELKEKSLTSEGLSSVAIQKLLDANPIQTTLESNGFNPKILGNAWSLYTSGVETEKERSSDNLHVFRFSQSTPFLEPSLKEKLEASGWKITDGTTQLSANDISSGSTFLVLDEIYAPVLTEINEEQWDALKTLITSGRDIVWVTKGAQLKVTDPNTALAHGLFRVARREDANVKLTVLDVESTTGPTTTWAIDSVLQSIRDNDKSSPKEALETEFTERNGVLYVHRVMPDAKVNEFKRAEKEGSDTEVRNLRDTKAAVQLRSERVGTFQSLTWNETAVDEVPVEEGRVEVEVFAVGVNFKDVAVAMGIVPENEYTIGYEAAGIVKRLGPGTTKFKEGDRVCFLNGGSYANRLQVPIGRSHIIPDWMSFEVCCAVELWLGAMILILI